MIISNSIRRNKQLQMITENTKLHRISNQTLYTRQIINESTELSAQKKIGLLNCVNRNFIRIFEWAPAGLSQKQLPK